MKLTVEQKPLATVLKRLAGIVQARGTIPILQNVAITAREGVLTFRATDLDIQAATSIAADVAMKGYCTVSAKLMADIVGKLPSTALVAIECDDGHMAIKAGRSNFKLATLPFEDFPIMASSEYDSTFSMSHDDLGAVFSTVFCASTEESRYYLQGVYLHPVAGQIVGVATTGHMLAKVARDMATDFPGVIVPRKTVNEVLKSFAADVIDVSVSETKIRFATPDFTLVSKVIDGTFPDYTRVIPASNNGKVTFGADDMRNVIDRVTAVSDERSRGVAFDMGADGIGVSSKSATSSGSDSIAADVDGETVTIGFNGGYMLEVIRQFTGDVTMEYGTTGDPALLKRQDGALYVVMPMRV